MRGLEGSGGWGLGGPRSQVAPSNREVSDFPRARTGEEEGRGGAPAAE